MLSLILTVLLIGLLTAFAFQCVLTNLGLALGISFWSWSETDPDSERSESSETTEPNSETWTVGFLTGTGILISHSLALFLACFLAIKFTQISDLMFGAIAGIVIWAADFLLLIWLSSLAMNSILTALLGATMGGLRRILSTLATALQPQSPKPAVTANLDQIQEVLQDLLSPLKLQAMIQAQLAAQPGWSEPIAALPATSTHSIAGAQLPRYLETSTPRKLTPKQIDRHLHKLWLDSHPWPRFTDADRLRLTQCLQARSDLSDKRKARILQQIEVTWNALTEPVGETLDVTSPDVSADRTHLPVELLQSAMKTVAEQVWSHLPQLLEQLNIKLPNWSTLAPVLLPLILDRVREVAQLSFPDAAASSMLEHSVEAALQTTQSRLARLEGSLVDQVEWAGDVIRDQISQPIEGIQQAIQAQWRIWQQQTQQRLQQTRQATALAAWWFFAIALSGLGSAALAGMLATGQDLLAFIRVG